MGPYKGNALLMALRSADDFHAAGPEILHHRPVVDQVTGGIESFPGMLSNELLRKGD